MEDQVLLSAFYEVDSFLVEECICLMLRGRRVLPHENMCASKQRQGLTHWAQGTIKGNPILASSSPLLQSEVARHTLM